MEGLAHLLSLKVMRVSRPTIASAWEPFYSSSPSFSAHSTASILSLQGKTPLDGHPKTLRDLSHATEMLTLPSSFGSIQLGETFTSCLCVNNEASVDIHGVSLKVEMQTATSKMTLAEFGGEDCQLSVGGTLEDIVQHEIKELGQHVLGCTVSYRLPPNSRNPNAPITPLPDQNVQTFRKYYKFVVTNPLSVKTKVHMPRSPSALFSSAERNKVFLEVHIQNLTQDALWFERMRFECVDGWGVEDANVMAARTDREQSLYTHSTALMYPQDTRQYIYILQPVSMPSFPVNHEPGSSIPFGRLDISWRSAFGEPGRLLTSMLSRRIPVSQPLSQTPASAVPPYLKRSAPPSNVPSRPHSPQAMLVRTGTPPPIPRPSSPFRNLSQPTPTRSQSPGISTPQRPPASDPSSNVRVDLLLHYCDRETITVEKPFFIKCNLIVSAAPPSRHLDEPKGRRILTLAVQHVQPPRVLVSPVLASFSDAQIPSPQGPSLLSTHTHVPSNPVRKIQSLHQGSSRPGGDDGDPLDSVFTQVPLLPGPFAEGADEANFAGSSSMLFLGNSIINLDPIELLCGEGETQRAEDADSSDVSNEYDNEHVLTTREFELSYLPLQKGFCSVGGLRVLLLGDKLINGASSVSNENADPDGTIPQRTLARVLEEWSVFGEVWVKA